MYSPRVSLVLDVNGASIYFMLEGYMYAPCVDFMPNVCNIGMP